MTALAKRPARRLPDPEIEARKVSASATFFRDMATTMNGFPPSEDQVRTAAAKMARGLPPYWDWRTRRYL